MPETIPAATSDPHSFADKRREAISELIETEKTYVSRLNTTYKVYMVGTQDILTETERFEIFSNIEEVLMANDDFLNDLQKCCNISTGEGLGNAFLKHLPKFSVYIVYCRNQNSSIKLLQEKMKEKPLNDYIINSLSHPECSGLDLSSFLLEPVQRLTRYPMLLKQIQKFTSASVEEFSLLAIAIDECQALLDRLNQSMLEGEERSKLVQLQRRLSSHSRSSNLMMFEKQVSSIKLPVNLAGLTRNYGERRILKSGLWTKLRSRRLLVVFLFTDFILMTEAVSGDTDHSSLEDPDVKLKVYRNPVHLDDIWLIKEAESSKIPSAHMKASMRALEIESSNNDPLDIHIPTEEFESWIEAISAAKRKLKVVSKEPSFLDQQSDLEGVLRLTIVSASNIRFLKNSSDVQYFCRLDYASTLISSGPARGPNPVWNQTFSLPVLKSKQSLKVELCKYNPFEICETFGEFQLDLSQLHELSVLDAEIFTLTASSNSSDINPCLHLKINFTQKQ